MDLKGGNTLFVGHAVFSILNKTPHLFSVFSALRIHLLVCGSYKLFFIKIFNDSAAICEYTIF